MTNEQIKDYLEKYSLTTKEKLAQHILELKRNTKPNLELISELNYVLVDEENLFFNFFGGEKLDRRVRITTEDWENYDKIVGDLEGINKPPQKELNNHISEIINDKQQEIKSMTYLDEVLEQNENKGCSWTKCGQKDCVCCYPNSAEKEIKTEENKGHSTRLKANTSMQGVKETQTVEKAPIFTYCKANKNALEALSLRALYGHKKYEKENDWENFARVPNGDFEYANSQFRHALNIGEENEKDHLISSAWNAVARLEIYLRKNNEQ